MLISPLFFAVSSIWTSIQDSFKTFFFRSLAPLFYNLGIILGILYLSPSMGIQGVAWGVVIGALLQALIQIPALVMLKVRITAEFDLRRQDVRKAFHLMVPRFLGLSLNQLTLLANTGIASFLSTGSIALYYFADNLQALPLGIIAISIAITSFATFSELASEPTHDAFAKEMRNVLHKMLYLILPASLGMLFLRKEIIEVVLMGGQFSAVNAAQTASILFVLLLSLFAQSMIPILSRGFYAFHNTRTPLFFAIFSSLLQISLAVLLSLKLGFGILGVAIAFSIGSTLNAFLLFISLSKKCKKPLLGGLSVFKMLLSTGIMLSVLFFVEHIWPAPTLLLPKFLWLSAFAGIGFVIYFMGSVILRIPERSCLKVWKRKS